jgi:hypothetical protein
VHIKRSRSWGSFLCLRIELRILTFLHMFWYLLSFKLSISVNTDYFCCTRSTYGTYYQSTTSTTRTGTGTRWSPRKMRFAPVLCTSGLVVFIFIQEINLVRRWLFHHGSIVELSSRNENIVSICVGPCLNCQEQCSFFSHKSVFDFTYALHKFFLKRNVLWEQREQGCKVMQSHAKSCTDIACHAKSVSDFAWLCMLLRAFVCQTLLDFAWLCVLRYCPVQNLCRFYDAKSTLPDFAWLCLTLHDFAWLCTTLHDFACVSDTFQVNFSQPCKVVLQSIANTCKVDFLWQRSFVLHRNNIIYGLYLNDLK